MQAEILNIGTELLLGNIQDTNSKYIAEKLAACGLNVYHITTVGDNKKRIISLVTSALQRSNIIITTGGLGPTEDDLTREAIAEAIDIPLIQNEKLLANIREYFASRNYNMTANNNKQALIPEGAKIIQNPEGTAPGFICKYEEKSIISLPGVPREMKKMFSNSIVPYLKKLQNNVIKSRTLHFIGIGESSLETKFKDNFFAKANPTLALLAGKGEVKIRITASAASQSEASKMLKSVENKIRNKVGEYIYGTDNESLPEAVGKLLKNKNLTLSLAESCTGGLLGKRFTDIPGSSAFFRGGVTAYSNQIKRDVLQVKPEILTNYGAVSQECAQAMAIGVFKLFNTDIALSITGIAGPGGGTEKKPVGTVYIGIKYKMETFVHEFNFHGTRKHNRWLSTQKALFMLFNLFKYGRLKK